MATLASTRVGSVDAAKTIVMLHGIYGWGRNWQTIAKALVDARPDYACLLVDLPYHGGSGVGSHELTVTGVAADVIDGLRAQSLAPDAILGHSFGGKVALAMTRAWSARPLQVWVIDSTPETRAPSGSAWDMLQAVRALPPRFASRDALVAALTSHGWAPGVAQWMATNLVRDGDAFVWRLDFDVMERLLHNFFSTDLWPIVEHPAPGHVVHFVKASQSSAMSDDAVRRADAQPRDRVIVHHLDGGHWIHAESPQAIVDLLAAQLA
jgi:pimeloyl-ACP methyl ester carboxylesterase